MFPQARWDNLQEYLRKTWKQGEHVLAIAPTGRGKTVLLQELMPMREDVVFFGTKIHDEEYDRMRRTGWKRATKWPPPPWHDGRTMLWPRPGKSIAETQQIQRDAFREALDRIYLKGKRTVVLDELHWMAEDLGLKREIASLHHQGRSSKLTLIDGFQRPAWVPRIVYSSASHLFVWGTNDPNDIKALSTMAQVPVKTLQDVMPKLGQYEFVYFPVRNVKQTPVRCQVER